MSFLSDLKFCNTLLLVKHADQVISTKCHIMFTRYRRLLTVFVPVFVISLISFHILLIRYTNGMHEKFGAMGVTDKHFEDFEISGNRISSLEEILKERQKAKQENVDEFILEVLREYKYWEVNLTRKRMSAFDDFDEEIRQDFQKVVPGLGEGGVKASVLASQAAIAEEITKKEAFNRLLSQMISMNRSVRDNRDSACKYMEYDTNDLPDVSVIIIFINEAFSTLVRTIHSVINRSPSKFVKEIILVDDFSDNEELQGKLERYIARQLSPNKVRLVRLLRRAGLIRARMIGAHLAIGKVLVFLDAHCETVQSWLEPLLSRIQEDRTIVVVPIIDIIDPYTLEFLGSGDSIPIGGFSWDGEYYGIKVPDYEARRKIQHHAPTRSATMAGGLFAIDRKYFWELGSYDPGMEIWGGENLEISFRIWQCGGSLEVIPCSRVGHLFRQTHPYTFPGNIDSHGLNAARVAEVWMDEYKELFYKERPDLKTKGNGDVSRRQALRKRLKCKGFKWFLDNIYKEKFRGLEQSTESGQVKHLATNQCLDDMGIDEHSSDNYTLEVYPCQPTETQSQLFFLSIAGELRREFHCAAISGGNTQVDMPLCDELLVTEKWEFKDSALRHLASGRCLAIATSSGKHEVILEKCVPASVSQQWIFKSNRNIN